MKTITLLAVAACLALQSPALAQGGTRADYELANNLGKIVTGKVFRAAVKPNWINASDRFWYRNDLPGGKREFILVDPAGPTRRPAFDHARLAAALTQTLGKPVTAERLPVEHIAFTPDKPELLVQLQDKTYACDLNTYALHEAKGPLGRLTPLSLRAAPRASRSGGEDTQLTFLNKTTEDVALYWLDTEGQR